MKVTLGTLKNLLENNVCEIKFTRRRPVAGEPLTRRMLCTNSVVILQSLNGKLLLNYRQPKRVPKFNPNTRNIVVTWDIFMQDFRCINMDSCDLIQTIPGDDNFWNYFNEKLRLMTAEEKEKFMSS